MSEDLVRHFEKLKAPVYVAVDVSSSMGSATDGVRTPWEAANDGLQDIFNSLFVDDPELLDICLVSVITFGSKARVHRRLLQDGPLSLDPLPPPAGQTNFRELFETLTATIDADIAQLTQRRWATKRPAVYILTDGQPYVGDRPQTREEYLPAMKALHSREIHTTRGARSIAVVPFGLGRVTASTLCDMRSTDMSAYIAPSRATGELVRNVMRAILDSIIASASSNEIRVAVPSGVKAVDCPRP